MAGKQHPIKIGLEVHGYLNTKEKLFCMCKASFKNEKPNTDVCPICTGQPGSKPMLINNSAVDKLVEISLILGCKINHDKNLIWNRKHYSWADLPKGYQTTISGAHALFPSVNGKFLGINIWECHLEEDPARWNPDTGGIDYNRSGLPLLEIVTAPDFSSSEQVANWLRKLIHHLSYINAIRKGAGIKVDVNVSTYGERVEIKNMNSIENIQHAINYEIIRQVEAHGQGEIQKVETLTYDVKLGKTIKMRDKEGAADYRFIPDPDLPAIKLDEKEIKKMKYNLPEMPEIKLRKLIEKYNIDKANADILVKNLELVEFVEELAGTGINIKKNIFWVTIELLRILNYNKKSLNEVNIKPKHLAELILEVDKKNITILKAKQIMNDFVPKSFSISEKENIGKISDEEIEKLCKKVISENKKAVEDYKSGNKKSLNFLVGCVMRLSERRADFKMAGNFLRKFL